MPDYLSGAFLDEIFYWNLMLLIITDAANKFFQ